MQFTIKLILIIFCNLCGNLFAADNTGSELGDFDIKLDQAFGLSRLAMHKLRLEHPAFELLLEEAIRGDAELKVAVDNLGFMIYGKASQCISSYQELSLMGRMLEKKSNYYIV